jgi:ketosteroid isomerase-like protein
MGEDANRQVVERLVACINERRIEVMDELFHEDAVMDWPQSGEQVIGGDARRAVYGAFPALPTVSPRRIHAAGDLVVLEARLEYGAEAIYHTVFVLEFRDGRIARETAYWAEPFEAPAWRSQWVTRAPS